MHNLPFREFINLINEEFIFQVTKWKMQTHTKVRGYLTVQSQLWNSRKKFMNTIKFKSILRANNQLEVPTHIIHIFLFIGQWSLEWWEDEKKLIQNMQNPITNVAQKKLTVTFDVA